MQELIKRARFLRANMTDSERILWSYLKSRQLNGYKFRRQHIIGSYIVDFEFGAQFNWEVAHL